MYIYIYIYSLPYELPVYVEPPRINQVFFTRLFVIYFLFHRYSFVYLAGPYEDVWRIDVENREI
jgi:hypothetical protein